MSRADLGFRVWDSELEGYRGAGGDEVFMLSLGGELVRWNLRDGKHRTADKGFIVERCTGFADANGRLIYQGDIIERRDAGFAEKYFRRAIYLVPHYARFYEMRPSSGVRHPLDADSAAECRVIGNVNENSELLGLKTHYEKFEKGTQQ